jgi:hypothetical protein
MATRPYGAATVSGPWIAPTGDRWLLQETKERLPRV